MLGPPDDPVPGIAWLPAPLSARARVPIVVFGHGLSHDKRSPLHAGLARRLAAEHGVLSLAPDAPAHGERRGASGLDAEQQWRAYRATWRRWEGRDMAAAITEAVRLVCAEHGVAAGALGYWGLSLGTQYGLAFLADNPRVSVAVLGLFGSGPRVDGYARAVRCPVFFLRQLDDALHSAESTLALYQQLSHPDCRLSSSPGAHEAVPEAAIHSATDFLLARLGAE